MYAEHMANEGIILFYQTDDGKVTVDVRFENETFWLTKKAIAEVFDVDRSTISRHLKNIFHEGELDEQVVCAFFAHTTKHGAIADKTQTDDIQFYNLDAVIAVGYRVNSKKATRFRQWATRTLREYIQKGFVMNDEYLKNGRPFGRDYFDELLERIREIRASERRAYQKITDIFEQTSSDYDKDSELTKNFYAFVQNKLHHAITGKTAAEIVHDRVDLAHPTMGLTTWKAAPDGKIIKSDVSIAKNYLNEKEISKLNRIVTMFIDYAELMAEDGVVMKMQDWVRETDTFLRANRRNVLLDKGKISHEQAIEKAENIYKEFRVKQDKDYISNFDKATAKYFKGEASDENPNGQG